MHVLIITMYKQKSLIKAVMEAGASGYVLKDDRNTLENLGTVIRMITNGGFYFGKEIYPLIMPTELNLSPRQIEILSLCAAYPDKTSGELADRLGLTDATVRSILSQTYARLYVRSRTAAVSKATALGLHCVS